jgi:hypothetical protein
MSTVSEAVYQWIHNSPFIEETLEEGLINISSLARKMQPEISDQLKSDVKLGAIVMAIQRRNPGAYRKVRHKLNKFFSNLGDITVRSGLSEFTYQNSKTMFSKQSLMLDSIAKNKSHSFCTFSQGVGETTVIISDDLLVDQKKMIKGEKLLNTVSGLASITIRMPMENLQIPGIYYFIMQRLAWAGINVVEVISTTCEFTLVMNEKDIDNAFMQLLNFKRSFANRTRTNVLA